MCWDAVRYWYKDGFSMREKPLKPPVLNPEARGPRYWHPPTGKWLINWNNTYRYNAQLSSLLRYIPDDGIIGSHWARDTFDRQMVQGWLFNG